MVCFCHFPIVRFIYDELIYEVKMVGFAQFGDALNEFSDSLVAQQRQMFYLALRRELIKVMLRGEFRYTLLESTTSPFSVHRRHDMWGSAIQDIVRNPEIPLKETTSIHHRLSESSICSVCPSQLTADDAVWVSINGDRKLVHRFCQSIQPV